jgi:uncharacterized Zn-finger protein
MEFKKRSSSVHLQSLRTHRQQPYASLRHKGTTLQSLDEKSDSLRHHPGYEKEGLVPFAGPSRRAMSINQPSISKQMSPEMSSINYSRTGRVSKVKKGLKVHTCECGRSYTRAEHLRRHRKNHQVAPLVCDLPGCGKTFYRLDLLQRHQERHKKTKEVESQKVLGEKRGESPCRTHTTASQKKSQDVLLNNTVPADTKSMLSQAGTRHKKYGMHIGRGPCILYMKSTISKDNSNDTAAHLRQRFCALKSREVTLKPTIERKQVEQLEVRKSKLRTG